MIELLNINNTFFTIWGYPMSYIEFFGTIFNIWCVWLVAKNNIWTWPVGIVGIVLFGFLFYQINLYSDLFEQAYYLVTSFYGWYIWANIGNPALKNSLPINGTSNRENKIYILIIILGTIALGYFTANIHIFLADYFPEPASFPYLDAFTTVLSFAATILMVHKKIECWYLWIVVDVIGICLYFVKEVKFISLLYLIFLLMAMRGYFAWKKEYKNQTI